MNYWEAAQGNLLDIRNVVYIGIIGGYPSMYIGKNLLSITLLLVPLRPLLFFKN